MTAAKIKGAAVFCSFDYLSVVLLGEYFRDKRLP
jgi:hypothetical protein